MKDKQRDVGQSPARKTLWSNNSVDARKTALSFKFSAKTLETLSKQEHHIEKGDEEEKYKTTLSKDVLSKIID